MTTAAPRTRRRRIALACVGVLLAPWVALAVAAAFTPLPPELLAPPSSSLVVLDAAGQPLREVRASDGKRARVLSSQEIGPALEHAILAAEDARFYAHPGVDPLAVLRACVTDLLHARVVSGASTLTMQLARTVRPHPRTLLGKLGEMALALRIEASLPKERVFALYANEVDFGPNVRGVGAASRAVFGKSPRALSIAEAALLAGLPRGPSLYALGKRTALVRARRDRVLERMESAGWITPDEERRAVAEPIGLDPDHLSFGAPHLVAALARGELGATPGADRIETTLDGDLQRAAERATLATVDALADRHVTAGAVVVLDNRTGDLLAYVGSPDYLDEARLGANDGARALRQPGSALKPFLYALAVERLGFTAATALPDVPLRIADAQGGGDFAPLDYDGHFHGPVRLRDALGGSLNVPAVWTLSQLGVAPFLDRLHALGFDTLTRSAEDYGTALALGDGEVTLLQLAGAYATLARGGMWRPVRVVRSAPDGEERRVIDAAAAAQIADVLSDPRARLASFGEGDVLRFPFDVAAKTGTSQGYRDNWAVGFTSAVTVAAWVGNFDGSPMGHVSGISGAGPLFHAVMLAAMRGREARSLRMSDAQFERVEVCALSGERAGHDCHHTLVERMTHERAASLASCSMHARGVETLPAEYGAWAAAAAREGRSAVRASPALHIDSPADGDAFFLVPDRPASLQAIDVRVAAPDHAGSVVILVDGAPVATLRAPYVLSWPLAAGSHEIVARSGSSRSPPVRVRVD